MSVIDVAAATNSAATTAKSKAGAEEADNGAFGRIYESVGRKSSEETRNTPKDKAGQKAKGDAIDGDILAPAPQSPDSDTDNPSLDLGQLIGGGASVVGQTPTDNDAAGKKMSPPLRRDILSHLPTVASNEEDPGTGPKAPRLTILSQETHFAPVGRPQNRPADQAKVTPAPIDALITSGNDASFEPGPVKASAIKEKGLIPNDPALQEVHSQAERPGTKKSDLSHKITVHALAANKDGEASTLSPVKASLPSVSESMPPLATTGGVLIRIADQLISQAHDLAIGGKSDAVHASAPTLQAEQHSGPVRILRLQLQPEELGMVTARLRIVGGILELRLTADRQQSVEILQRDQEGLLEALRRAGYKAEIASIDFARPLNGNLQTAGQQQTSSGSGQSFDDSSFADSHGAGGFSDGSGRSTGDGQAQHQHSANNKFSEEPQREGQENGLGRQSHDPQSIYL